MSQYTSGKLDAGDVIGAADRMWHELRGKGRQAFLDRAHDLYYVIEMAHCRKEVAFVTDDREEALRHVCEAMLLELRYGNWDSDEECYTCGELLSLNPGPHIVRAGTFSPICDDCASILEPALLEALKALRKKAKVELYFHRNPPPPPFATDDDIPF